MKTTNVKSRLIAACFCIASGRCIFSDVAYAQVTVDTHGGQARECRELTANVTNVVMSGPMQLMLRSSVQPALYIQGDPKLVEKVTTRIEGNTLYIGTRGIFVAVGKMPAPVVELSLSSLEKLALSGSGPVLVQEMKGNTLDIDSRGSGDLSMTAQYQKISVKALGSGSVKLRVTNSQDTTVLSRGSGSISLEGKTTQLHADVLGSGGLNAIALESNRATIQMSGSGDVAVNVSEEIKAAITGSGQCQIQGNPSRRVIQHTGSGQVIWR